MGLCNRIFRLRNLIFYILIIIQINEVRCDEKSLYAPGDNVLELETSNFNSTVYNQQKAFFVEFYSSWCGHCINYKPKWVEFATNLKDWSPIVQITVVNCADEKNSPVCREHEIDAFPTLKYFPPNSRSNSDGERYNGDKYDLDSMTLDLVKMIYNNYTNDPPLSWPKLSPLSNDATLNTIWSNMDSTKQILAVVIDEESLLTAYSTMINYAKSPFIHVVGIKSTHPIAIQYGGVTVPTLLIFKRENLLTPDYSSHSTSLKFVEIQKKIDEYVGNIIDSGHQAPAPALAKEPSPEPVNQINVDVPINWEQYKVQHSDIISAMKYMLYMEIPRKPIIKDENLEILKNWIHLLKKYLPGTAPIRRLLYRLDEWTQLQYSIKAEDWINKIDQLQSDLGNPLPSEPKWIACKGSKSYLRGYTCGMWTTMHAVTVQAYSDEKDNHLFKPVADVLEPLHQFIYKYLSCEICAKNFHKMAVETMPLNLVTRSEDVVLWLWRAHNSANKRLSKDASEDPNFPKRQFPPEPLCHDCQLNGVYLEDKVLSFMIRYYIDIRTDGIVPEPGYKVTEFENGKLQKVANRHLNPKFNIHADKVDQLEEAEARMRNIDGSPKHTWRNIDSSEYGRLSSNTSSERSTFYFIWLVIIVAGVLLAYSKYKQNRSKFWKTLYYYDKMFPWSKDSPTQYKSKYVA